MIKKIVLTNIVSICILLSAIYLIYSSIPEIVQCLIFFLLVIGYCILNIVMLVLNEIQKKEIEHQDYKFAILNYVFNLLYPVIFIISSLFYTE